MITSINVSNFKCFPSLTLSDLGKINIIVGDNGSGKTALLEAILLAAGAPELIGQLKSLRGVVPLPGKKGLTQSFDQSFWKDLFSGLSLQRIIEIEVTGTVENQRKVSISYKPANESLVTLENPGQASAAPVQTGEIVFDTTDLLGKSEQLHVKLVAWDKMQIKGERRVPPAAIFLHGSTALASQVQSVQDFDKLSKRNEEDKFIHAFSKVYQHVTNLTVIDGVLHCSLPELPEKIPVSYMSNGINKLLAIMLGIANRPGGVYLIDEIENGFYYTRMPRIWEAITSFANDYGVQLFISTHSKECLEAALPLIHENTSNFRLLRIESENELGHTVKTFSGNVLKAILKTGDVDARSGD